MIFKKSKWMARQVRKSSKFRKNWNGCLLARERQSMNKDGTDLDIGNWKDLLWIKVYHSVYFLAWTQWKIAMSLLNTDIKSIFFALLVYKNHVMTFSFPVLVES